MQPDDAFSARLTELPFGGAVADGDRGDAEGGGGELGRGEVDVYMGPGLRGPG